MGEFLAACGATGPLTLVVEDAHGALAGRWELPQPFALIGRDPRAELTLDDPAVSRRHAYVQVLDGAVFWIDLGSRGGVMSRAGVAEPSGWLDPGEAIGMGPYRIRLAGGVPGRNPRPDGLPSRPNPLARGEHPDAWGPLPPIVLEAPRKAGGPARWRVRQVMTLAGQAPDCRLQIRDAGISRYHAALLRTPGGVWLIDLLGRDGVRVNGARARWSRLVDGDQVHLGRYRLIVHVGEATGAPDGSGSEAEHAVIPPLPRDQFPALLAGMAPPAFRNAPEGRLREVLQGRPSEQVELAEALLEPLVQQFSQMQQQMFDQFHQAMLTMFQMFGSLHRDQMGVVRDELARIRQLGQELQTLQTQLQEAEAVSSRPTAPGIGPGPAFARSTGPETAAGSRPPASGPAPARPAPAPEPHPDRQPPVGASGRPPAPSPAAVDDPAALHARLARRIHEIQDERQTRWQRLVQLLGGSRGAAP